MNLILGIIIVLINLYVLIKNEQKGLMLFVILSLVSPVTIVMGYSLYYDYLFLPVLILWSLSKYGINLKRFNKTVLPLFLCFFWGIVITVITATTSVSEIKVGYVSILGTLKYLTIYIILINQSVIKTKFLSIIRAVVVINCIAMIIEFVLLQIYSEAFVIKLWIQLYSTLGSSGSLNHMLEFGTVGRLYGTFSSSAFPATLSILGIGIFMIEYKELHSWKSIFSILACLFCGIGSSSKRFYLGGILIVLVVFVFSKLLRNKNEYKKRSIDWKLPFLFLFAIMTLFVLYQAFHNFLSLDYYLEYLKKGDFIGAFSTRFGDDGVTNSMIPYIKENWLTGVGEVTYSGVLVTDSQLFVSLYKNGIIGIAFYAMYFLGIFRKIVKEKSLYKFIVFSIVLFEFVISTEFYSQLGILLLIYLTANKNSYKKIVNSRTNTF